MRYVLPLLCLATPAFAIDCPPDMPVSCKVLFLSPQEEQALTGQNGIFATAAQGRFIDLDDAVHYFRNKLAAAPAGEVKKPEPPKPAEPAK